MSKPTVLKHKDLLHIEANDQSRFVESGGKSIDALTFVDRLDTELQRLSFRFNFGQVLDKLLHETFETLRRFLVEQVLDKRGNEEKHSIKRMRRIDEQSNLPHRTRSEDETTPVSYIRWFSKNQRVENEHISGGRRVRENPLPRHLSIEWTYDTGKCVDATPLLVVVSADIRRILVGSHSHRFVCLDANANGRRVVWSFSAGDRIESSACLSKCGRFVYFGTCQTLLIIN